MANFRESHPHLAGFRNFCHLYDMAYEKYLRREQNRKYCPFDEANSRLQTIYCLSGSSNIKMLRKSLKADLGMYTRPKLMRRKLSPSKVSPTFNRCKLNSKDLSDMFMDYVVVEYIDNFVAVERLKKSRGEDIDEKTKSTMKRKSQTIDHMKFLDKFLRNTTEKNQISRAKCIKQISKKLARRYKRLTKRLEKAKRQKKKERLEHTQMVMSAINALWTEVLVKMFELSEKIPVLEIILKKLPREFA